MNLATTFRLGLDGHDGAGKTTLGRAAATALGAEYVAPFAGRVGARLLRAASSADYDLTLEVGAAALSAALSRIDPGTSVVLDRSWMTVASLVPPDVFDRYWCMWIPTLLCWTDLPTTLARLNVRAEAPASLSSHRYYLRCYRDIAVRHRCFVIDTSKKTEGEALQQVLDHAATLTASTAAIPTHDPSDR